jgi:murein DD-endopeptidase MepM/ murein hydrolase activator NlpD
MWDVLAYGVACIAVPRQVSVETAIVRTYGRPMPPPISPIGTALLPETWVRVPMIFPVIGPVQWRRTYNQNRGRYRHTGEDLVARKLTPVVAPFDGYVALKPFSFWIYGDNGYRCLGTHMNDDTPGTNDNAGNSDTMFAAGLKTGDRVVAGQLIGYVGDSTNATAPHLHFELHSAFGVVSPRPSLKYAQKILRPFPTLSISGFLPGKEDTRYDGELRKVDAANRVLTILLTAKQFATGRALGVSRPSYFRARLSPEQWEEWVLLRESHPTTSVAFHVRSGTDLRTVERAATVTAMRLIVRRDG